MRFCTCDPHSCQYFLFLPWDSAQLLLLILHLPKAEVAWFLPAGPEGLPCSLTPVSLGLHSSTSHLVSFRTVFGSLASVPAPTDSVLMVASVGSTSRVLTGWYNHCEKLAVFTKAKQTPTFDPAILPQRRYLHKYECIC